MAWSYFGDLKQYRVNRSGTIESRLVKGGNFRLPNRLGNWKPIIPVSAGTGYLGVNLKISGKFKKLRIHRVVCLQFLPNPAKKAHINHIDGNKHNNCLSNLEWATPSENERHKHLLKKRY